jgi:YesN/AraC family two-component response regulator
MEQKCNHGDFSDFVIEMRDEIKSKLCWSSLRIGISHSSSDLTDIPLLYQQSVLAAKSKFHSNVEDIVLFSEIEYMQSKLFDKTIDIQLLYYDIQVLIADINEISIQSFFNQYYGSETVLYSENHIKGLSLSIVNILQLIVIEANQPIKDIFESDRTLWEKLSEFSNIHDLKQWMLNIIVTVSGLLYNKTSMSSRIVLDIKMIIKNKYHEQITAGDIAKSIYLSVVHANNIFKNTTGKTIFEFLTEYRIEMAKHMLKDPDSRINIVAERTGYPNKSYFCSLFKRYTGLTPKEYKHRMTLQE